MVMSVFGQITECGFSLGLRDIYKRHFEIYLIYPYVPNSLGTYFYLLILNTSAPCCPQLAIKSKHSVGLKWEEQHMNRRTNYWPFAQDVMCFREQSTLPRQAAKQPVCALIPLKLVRVQTLGSQISLLFSSFHCKKLVLFIYPSHAKTTNHMK